MTDEPRKDAMLSYAPAGHNRRRRIYRGLLWFCIVAVIIFSMTKIAPEALRRARMVYYQHRVLNAEPQSDPPFISEPGGPRQNADGTPAPPGGRRTTWFSSGDWYRYLLASLSNPVRACSTVYVHGINDRHGNQLAIAVAILPGIDWDQPTLDVQIVTPGGLFTNPSVAPTIVRPFAFDFDLKSLPDAKLTIFNGQPDPEDRSHFSIDYELNGQRHTLDGQIDDQDVLTIQKRKEPNTVP